MAQHKGPQKWSNYFLAKEDVWKNVYPPSKLYVKSLSPNNFSIFMHRIIVMVSNQMMTLYRKDSKNSVDKSMVNGVL